MSTVADVITDIRDDLKDTGTTQKFTDAQIIRYMNRFRIYLAAMNYRHQITASITNTNVDMTASTETYAVPSDFYAERLIHFNDKTEAIKKITLEEYVAAGLSTATTTGTSDKYMILDTTLYLNDPLPKDGTVTIWYYKIEAAYASDATDSAMPYGGILDQYWREFVSKLLLNRDEYNVQYEEFLFKQLEGNILSALVGRSPHMHMIPDQHAGPAHKQGIDAFYE